MLAIIIALVAVVSYLEVANQHGTVKMDLLYPPVREQVQLIDEGPRYSGSVTRFGYRFGAGND